MSDDLLTKLDLVAHVALENNDLHAEAAAEIRRLRNVLLDLSDMAFSSMAMAAIAGDALRNAP